VDAIVAANDMMALGAMNALKDAGVVVPGEVAVTGFDDIPLARYMGLTTVQVRSADLGARAVARLIGALEGARDAGVEFVTPELIVRSTSDRQSAA
jgi:LacI family transcriptional regulator